MIEDYNRNEDIPNSGLSYFIAATEDSPGYYWKEKQTEK